MSWRLIDPNENRGPDKVAGGACMVLGCVLILAAAALVIDVLRGCSDQRHGCGYVMLGAPIVTLIGIACIGAGYWLYPKRSRNDRDRPPDVR